MANIPLPASGGEGLTPLPDAVALFFDTNNVRTYLNVNYRGNAMVFI